MYMQCNMLIQGSSTMHNTIFFQRRLNRIVMSIWTCPPAHPHRAALGPKGRSAMATAKVTLAVPAVDTFWRAKQSALEHKAVNRARRSTRCVQGELRRCVIGVPVLAVSEKVIWKCAS